MTGDADRAREHRTVIADLVETRLHEFADRAADGIFEAIAAYRSGDPSLRPDVAAHCRDAYSAFAATLRRGDEPSTTDFATTADRATRRVAQGIDLTDFLRAFRITQGALWDRLLEAGEDDPAVAAASPAVVADLMLTFEVGSVGAARAYLEAQQYAVADSDRLRRDLVEDLLAGRVPVTSTRRGLLGALGLHDRSPYVLLLAAWVDEEADEEARLRRASAVLRATLQLRPAGLVALRQGQVLALLPVPPALADDELTARLESAVDALGSHDLQMRVGVSASHTRLEDVPSAHREALVAVRSLPGAGLRRLPELDPDRYLTLLGDSTALRLLRPATRRFVQEDLADGGQLIETLTEYAECDLNARAVAERMHLHVNSVYHRLDRISDRSGMDVRTFNGVSQVLTAVRLLRAAPSSSYPAGPPAPAAPPG